MPPKKPTTPKSGRKQSPNRSRAAKKTGRGRNSFDWRLHLTLLGAAVLLVGLVLLARREEQTPPSLPQPPPVVAVDSAAAAREQVEAFLAAAAIPSATITREPAEQPRHYQVRHRRPAPQAIDQLRQSLRRLSPPLALTAPADGGMTVTDSQGQTLLTIHFHPPPVPQGVVPAPGKPGRVAIIMDDLGRGTHSARQLLAIRQPVTLAILPGESHAAPVAELAHAAGREVMLHVPMEPQGFPVIDPGDDALLVNQSDEELQARMTALLEQVPHVAGSNNHMGSRFTEDQRAMAAIMAVLRAQGLFFVDSLTSSRSVGMATAEDTGVPALRRDLFLDNVADVAAITQQLRRLAGIARRTGSAVGICHPYPETLQALRQELPKLAGEGIEFVPVSALVKGGG